MNADEQHALERATDLGAAGLGSTSPNPSVGCVVLDVQGAMVGEGATRPPGGAHAEVMALRTAGDRSRGGTAVVTLEPCDHTGRTGPCTQALLAAGIARVVFAHGDPDPVARGGADTLRRSGIDVEQAPAGSAPYLRPWLAAVRLGRPFVTWKYAATLDGRIAARDGTSRWITGPEARADVHLLRSRVDAVLVGSGTVLADDPQLTARDAAGMPLPRQPLRVVMDRRGRTPDTATVLDASAASLVLAGDPGEVLGDLHGRGVRHVLLEGGPTLAGAFVAAGLVDEVIGYLAPALLGAGPAALGPAGVDTIADAHRLAISDLTRLGQDIRMTAQLMRST